MPVRARGRWRAGASAPLDEPGLHGVIGKYVALRKPDAERAMSLLRDVGRAVHGLMQRHGWRAWGGPLTTELPVLAEMYPKNASLLGLNYNQGQKICLRLRQSGRESSFLARDEVVSTYVAH